MTHHPVVVFDYAVRHHDPETDVFAECRNNDEHLQETDGVANKHSQQNALV